MRVNRIVWIAAVILAASAFAGVGAPLLTRADTGETRPGTLSVTGTGVVKTQLDTATTSFGVTTQATTAKAATAQNGEAMAKVIDALKRAGVDPKDIQTKLVSLDPRYDAQGREIRGYTSSNSVSAVVRDLPKVGDVIDAAIAAGANNVSGPTLAREDKDKLYNDALEAAVADARAKATVLAHAAGVSLGAVRSLAESPETQEPIPYAAVAMRAPGSTPVEPGTAEITATVSVVFALA
jgi:uncharacterized protein YggE